MRFTVEIGFDWVLPSTSTLEADPNKVDRYVLLSCDWRGLPTVIKYFHTLEEAKEANKENKYVIGERNLNDPIVRYWKGYEFGKLTAIVKKADTHPYPLEKYEEITYEEYIEILKQMVKEGRLSCGDWGKEDS